MTRSHAVGDRSWLNPAAATNPVMESVIPTPAGLQLFELLSDAAPVRVDPGTTAQWKMQLDAVVTGRADFQ